LAQILQFVHSHVLTALSSHRYTQDLKKVFNDMQRMELEREQTHAQQLLAYANAFSSVHQTIGSCLQGMAAAATSINCADDSKRFTERTKTGNPPEMKITAATDVRKMKTAQQVCGCAESGTLCTTTAPNVTASLYATAAHNVTAALNTTAAPNATTSLNTPVAVSSTREQQAMLPTVRVANRTGHSSAFWFSTLGLLTHTHTLVPAHCLLANCAFPHTCVLIFSRSLSAASPRLASRR
jgi:hypothetical protein